MNPYEELDESELFRTQQQLVTVASRYAQTVEQAPSIVTVITDRDLRSRGHRTVSDALREIPGIFTTVSKESRELAWFRGVIASDNNKFLLLVDGVPWYDGVYTHAWIDEYLPLARVKQIEVIKGPGSAIYGTNAFSGVVNVVTYQAEDLQGGFVRMEAGSWARRSVSAVMAESHEAGGSLVRMQAYAHVMEQDGDGMSLTPGGDYNVSGLNPRRNISGGMGLQVGSLKVQLDLVDFRHTRWTNSQADLFTVLTEAPDDFNYAYRNHFLSLRYGHSLGLLGQVSPYFYLQRYDNPGIYGWLGGVDSSLEADPGASRFGLASDATVESELVSTLILASKDTARYGSGVELELHPQAAHTTVAGAGVDVTEVRSLVDLKFVTGDDQVEAGQPVEPSDYWVDPENRWIVDAFVHAQHTWTANWWLELTGGARLDLHNFFGLFPSPRAGILILPHDDLSLKLLYGRAFRAPNARELLVSVGKDDDGENSFTASNPDLAPEQIDTIEGELRWQMTPDISIRTAAFYSQYQNEINQRLGDHPVLGDYYYANGGDARVSGGELQATWTGTSLELDGSYALTLAHIQPVCEEEWMLQYGVPVHMGHGRVSWEVMDVLSLSILGDLYGKLPRSEWATSSGLEDGPPVALVHLGMATDVLGQGRVRLDVSLQNLLDTPYKHLVFLDDADATTTDENGENIPRYGHDLEGEGRSVLIGMEIIF